MGHCHIQGNHRHNGFGEGQSDLQEKSGCSAAVQLRCLKQFFGQGVLEKRTGNNHIVYGD